MRRSNILSRILTMIRATIGILKKLAAYIEILGFGENSEMLPHKLHGRNTQENARNENLITLYNIFDQTLLKKLAKTAQNYKIMRLQAGKFPASFS